VASKKTWKRNQSWVGFVDRAHCVVPAPLALAAAAAPGV